MKLLYGALVLVYTPLVIAGNAAAYPTEKLAAFVVDKVDVTTLPSAIRPKSVKGKRRSAITDMWRASSRKGKHFSIRRREPRRFRSKYWKRRNLAFTFA